MITTTTWVRRGAAAPFPKKYEITEAEIDRISQLAKLQLKDARDALESAKHGGEGDETDDGQEQNGGGSAEGVLE